MLIFLPNRYIVDGEWMHDPELPALKTEQGHYNNMVKMRPSSGGSSNVVVIVKQPKADNLKKGIADLAFAAKNVSKAVVESRPEESAEASKDPRGEVVGIRYGLHNFVLFSCGKSFICLEDTKWLAPTAKKRRDPCPGFFNDFSAKSILPTAPHTRTKIMAEFDLSYLVEISAFLPK